jgi:hypothetical protein
MSPVKMNATLWGQDPPSIYRGKPGPEVDAAWKDLTAEHAIPISADEVKKLGKDPKTAVKFPESFGYGSDAYVAQVDVFHQIHCLDALREEMHRNYYSGLPSSSRNTMQKVHINHCVHVLLQNLLCESSVDLITYNWMEGLHFPFPDFDLTHQCRSFEALLDWQHDHMVDGRLYETISKPDDVVPLRPPHQLIYDIFTLNKGIFKPI